MNHCAISWAIATLAALATVLPLAAEGSFRSPIGRSSDNLKVQRQPRIEVHGISGVYSTAVHSGLLKREAGVGVLLPLGARWAALVDATVGAPRVNESQWKPGDPFDLETVFYARNLNLTNQDEHWRRVSSLRPSIVRTWRRDRFSIYAGVGLGLEFEHNKRRFRRILQVFDQEGNIVGQTEDDFLGALVRQETFTTWDSRSLQKSLAVRSGVLVSLSPRVVVRGGYSYLINSVGEPLSGAIEMGIGYRF